MQILLVTGPGGAGSSTVAAATALRLADAGGATEVTYAITIDLAIPMLGLIKRRAEKVILDTALKELKKRVEG